MTKKEAIGGLGILVLFFLFAGMAEANPLDPFHKRAFRFRQPTITPLPIQPIKEVKPFPLPEKVKATPIPVKPVKKAKKIVIDAPIEKAEAVLLPSEIEAHAIIPKVMEAKPIAETLVDPPEPPGPVGRVVEVPDGLYPIDPFHLPNTAPVDGGGPPLVDPPGPVEEVTGLDLAIDRTIPITPVPKVDRKPYLPKQDEWIGPPPSVKVDQDEKKEEPKSKAVPGDVVRQKTKKLLSEEERERMRSMTDRNRHFRQLGR